MTRLVRMVAAVRRRRVIVVAVVVAVLLSVGGGMGATWATAPAPMMSNGPSVQAVQSGLLLTLRIGPGPYFLSELLPVSVSVTNVSGDVVTVAGRVADNLSLDSGCGSILSVLESGGHAPTYEAPTTGDMSCPGPLPSGLAPGQTVSASGVLPITASGTVSLTADVRASIVATKGSGGQTYTAYTDWDPFTGHWPTVQLTVSSVVPLARTIHLARYGTRVYIIAPLAAWPHLLYLYSAGVRADRNGFGCSTGSFGWVPIKALWVDYLPWCGGYGTWTFAVGAPGFAIAQGSISG